MSSLRLQGTVLLMMLAALPLTNVGTTSDRAWVSALGLLAIGAASIVPPIFRWVGGDEEDDDSDEAG